VACIAGSKLTLSTFSPKLVDSVNPAVRRTAMQPTSTPPIDDRPRRGVLFGLLAGLVGLAGCVAFDYTGTDRPIPEASVEPMSPRPRVALVLGSGGPRGYAHLGVLKVLEEAGIPVDLVVGSSVGSLIGAFWADGLDAERLDARSTQGGPLTLFDPTPFADRGWIRGQRLQDYVNDGLEGRAFEQLPRRLVVVATRRGDKSPVFFRSGNVGVAVRASSAMPGIVSPVGIGGTEYEDADESLPVAVRAARQAGARFVIAVDVSARPGSTPPDASAAQRARDTRRRARIDPEVADADVLIHPGLRYDAGPWRGYFEHAREAGEASGREALPLLVARLRQAGLLESDTASGSAARPVRMGAER
jgi:NTE family protein